MVQINFALKEVNCKIVFYGPGMSGKTTNLEIVHQKAPDANKGELTSISTDGDRTLFFDFMPLDLGTVAGMRTKFQLYTVPGQIYYNATRKLVLQGVDGIIFVADSDPDKIDENIESYQNLLENLNEYGKDPAELPHVIQYNKRDLPNAMSVEDLDKALNKFGVPTFEAVANTGEGVFPTLKTLAGMVLESIDRIDQRRRSVPVRTAPQATPAGVGQVPPRHAGHAPATAEGVAVHHDAAHRKTPGSRRRPAPGGRAADERPSSNNRQGPGPGSRRRQAARPRPATPRRRRASSGHRRPPGGLPTPARSTRPRPAPRHRAMTTPPGLVEKKGRMRLMAVCMVILAAAVAGLAYFVMNPGF